MPTTQAETINADQGLFHKISAARTAERSTTATAPRQPPVLRHNYLMRALLILLAGASLASAQGLSVGTAQVTISPPAGTPMAGYYATRLSTGIHDDLHAKAIVIASGGQQAALVACDLVGIPPAVVEEAREFIHRATGISAANVMISATHSHTGPLIPDGGARQCRRRSRNRQALPRRLPGKIAESVRLAQAKLTLARASFGRGREDTVSFNRRYFMKDGTVGWNPGKLNPNIVAPAGPVDPELPLVLFESPKGEPLATYVNFALHRTVGWPRGPTDYAYTSSVRQSGAGMLTLFTIGPAGNINHIDVKSSDPQRATAKRRVSAPSPPARRQTYTRLQPVAGRICKSPPRGVAGPCARPKQAISSTPKPLPNSRRGRDSRVPRQSRVRHSIPRPAPASRFRPVQLISRAPGRLGRLPGEIFSNRNGPQARLAVSLTIVAERPRPVTASQRRGVRPGQLRGRHFTCRAATDERLTPLPKPAQQSLRLPAGHRAQETVTLFNGRNLDNWYTFSTTINSDPRRLHRQGRRPAHLGRGVGRRRDPADASRLPPDRRMEVGQPGPRRRQSADSGILVHGVGEDCRPVSGWSRSSRRSSREAPAIC